MPTLPEVKPIIGLDDQPLRASASAYDAGDRINRELHSWNPLLRSADADLLPELGTIVARTKDLVRNYGLMSGAVQTHLDHVVGAGLRLSAKPDWRALGISAEDAAEWARVKESRFRQWAYCVDKQGDAALRLNFAAQTGQGFRSFMTRGDLIAVAEWLPDRPFAYATALQMIAPERVCNPHDALDSPTLRGGFELDANGAEIAMHVRSHLPADWMLGQGAATWQRVPTRTAHGRRQVIHIYEAKEPGQTRGVSDFAAGLGDMKMLKRFERVSLEAAVLNTMNTMVIESELDNALEALGATAVGQNELEKYASAQMGFANGSPLKYDGAQIARLFPNEKLRAVASEYPNPDFAPFEDAFFTHLASGLNLSKNQLTRDYSKTNYSGARADFEHTWRHFLSRRERIPAEFGTQAYVLWLEEDIALHPEDQPPGAPDIYEAKTAWSGCTWIGPGKGNIDPLKDAKASEKEEDRGWKTLEQNCAERGNDWEQVLEQRARERKRIAELEEIYGLAPGSLLSKSESDEAVAEPTESE